MSKWEKNSFGQSLHGMFGKETADETNDAPPASSAESDWPSFDAAPQPSAGAYAQPQSEQTTYFAPGTIFEGTLHSINDVEIAGDFSGEIVSEGAVTVDNYQRRILGTAVLCLPHHLDLELVVPSHTPDPNAPDI